MSYARKGIDGSDVTLVYDHERQLWDCAPCDIDGHATMTAPWTALAHVMKHRDAGHSVPDHVFAMLKAESEDWPPKEPPAAAEVVDDG